MRLAPRLLSDDMIGLKQAAIASLGIVALPGYVCRDEVRSGALRRVLPTWLAGDSNDHGPRSLQTGPAAIGPRLHRTWWPRSPKAVSITWPQRSRKRSGCRSRQALDCLPLGLCPSYTNFR